MNSSHDNSTRRKAVHMFYRVHPGRDEEAREIVHRVAWNILSLSHHPAPEDQGGGNWVCDYYIGYGLWLLLRKRPAEFTAMALEKCDWYGALAYEPVFRSWDESAVQATLVVGHGYDTAHYGIE